MWLNLPRSSLLPFRTSAACRPVSETAVLYGRVSSLNCEGRPKSVPIPLVYANCLMPITIISKICRHRACAIYLVHFSMWIFLAARRCAVMRCLTGWVAGCHQSRSCIVSKQIKIRPISCYGMRIGNRAKALEWYHFQWPWVTSNPYFKGTPLFDVNVSETVKDRDIAVGG